MKFRVKVKGVKRPRIMWARSEQHIRESFEYITIEWIEEYKPKKRWWMV